MQLGAFSISLSVKDLQRSRSFYENLGFTAISGDMEQHYLIMKNGQSLVGLFQGMFEGNLLTFNPGWDTEQNTLENFDDVRSIQQTLKAAGLPLVKEADETGEGVAHIILTDPDGNTILIDQHVPKPD